MKRRKRRRDRGMALLVVLGITAVLILVVTMLLTATKVFALSAAVNFQRAEAKYAAESGVSHSIWMLLADRQQYRDRRMGVNMEHRAEAGDIEAAWMADSMPHTLQLKDQLIAQIKILDANRGWDVSGLNPGTRLRQKELAIAAEGDDRDIMVVDEFIDTLDDYVDSDDLTRINGMEAVDYIEPDMEGFPRNREMMFREEVYWIRNIAEVMPRLAKPTYSGPLPEGAVRLIQPRGLPGFSSAATRKRSFFSTPPELIQSTAQLAEDQMRIVLDARRQWIENQVPLDETLADLYGTLSANFDMTESGVYTVDVTAGLQGNAIQRRTVATVDLLRMPSNPVAGQAIYFSYWQKIIY